MEDSLEQELLKALQFGDTERAVSAWIKNHPLVLCHTITSFAFANQVVAEFPLGNDHRADFVLLGSFSGGFCIHFVEFEPPDAMLFTKSGVPAMKLNQALTQINDWKIFVDKHRSILLHNLENYFKDKELVNGYGEKPLCNAGWTLQHSQISLDIKYHIVIGRRANLSERQMLQKGSLLQNNAVNVMTYDRLVDAAKKLDSLEPRLLS